MWQLYNKFEHILDLDKEGQKIDCNGSKMILPNQEAHQASEGVGHL